MSNFITLDSKSILKEHICCAISDKKCKESYEAKKDWLKEEFEKGYVLRFQDGSIDWRVIGFTNPDVLMWKHLEPPKEQGE